MNADSITAEISRVRDRLSRLEAERIALQGELEALERQLDAVEQTRTEQVTLEGVAVVNSSSSQEKIDLFRSLFAGRSDVFPLRWENRKTGRSGYSPACFNEWVRGVCGKPAVKCSDCPHQSFIPPDDAIIEKHLRGDGARNGDFVAGVYPLLPADTCWFLAADFDKASWADDANALLETCRAKGVPAALERSRSGNGGHIWIFFSEPIPARLARQLGSVLITETMERRPEIGFASYDRLFPNQDTKPLGGFGNLIALPLQSGARKAGNSVFVDSDMRPYGDQWAYLSSLPRMSLAAVTNVALPRGCLDEVIGLLSDHGATADLDDLREDGTCLPETVRFRGELRQQQSRAFDALAKHDTGVLAATTAFGKTVVASALIAHRARNTLVLVHRRELLSQWVERLGSFLQIDPRQIGTIGAGKRKPTGVIDVALIQSLVRKGEVDDIVGKYGHLVVDECHHLSAASFELVARRSKARYVTGLSATVARKDGHHPIIFMQCGPVRHQVSAKLQAAESGIHHRARERHTRFRLPEALALAERPSIPAIYAALAEDEARNDLIFDDVLKSLEAKRSPIVLTERKDHLDYLQRRFARFAKNIVVLRGGMSAKDRKAAHSALNVADEDERLILATGRYIGEGFDDKRLDTLFLTMPIAWKGTLAQYVGRLHRQHGEKKDVLVVDYVDSAVPVLARMAAKRRTGYRALGYAME